MDESQRHFAEWEKPDPKDYMHDFIYLTIWKRQTLQEWRKIMMGIRPVAAMVWEWQTGIPTGGTRQSGGWWNSSVSWLWCWIHSSVLQCKVWNCTLPKFALCKPTNQPTNQNKIPLHTPKCQHVLSRMESNWNSHFAGGSVNCYNHFGKLFGTIC